MGRERKRLKKDDTPPLLQHHGEKQDGDEEEGMRHEERSKNQPPVEGGGGVERGDKPESFDLEAEQAKIDPFAKGTVVVKKKPGRKSKAEREALRNEASANVTKRSTRVSGKILYFGSSDDEDEEEAPKKRRRRRGPKRKKDVANKTSMAEKGVGIDDNGDLNGEELGHWKPSDPGGSVNDCSVKERDKIQQGMVECGMEEVESVDKKISRRGKTACNARAEHEVLEAHGTMEMARDSSEGRSNKGHSLRTSKSEVNKQDIPKVNKRNREWIEKVSLMCHQCQRNDKGEVVRCTRCKRKRFCLPCLKSW